MDKCFLQIITPNKVLYDGEVSMVEYNTTEGYVGVLPKHIPMTQVLAPGKLAIYEDKEKEPKVAALHAGFVRVMPDVITILAEIVEWKEDIDKDRALEEKKRAEEKIKTISLSDNKDEKDLLVAELSLKKALARINIAK